LPFYDGSVRVIQTGESNPGWHPHQRTSMRSRVNYVRDLYTWDPAIANPIKVSASDPSETGLAASVPAGWFRYTRGGNLGWDVPRGPVRATITSKPSGEQTLDTKTIENELDTSVGQW
jgi:hypothetical protein